LERAEIYANCRYNILSTPRDVPLLEIYQETIAKVKEVLRLANNRIFSLPRNRLTGFPVSQMQLAVGEIIVGWPLGANGIVLYSTAATCRSTPTTG
jgi:hypothetical protein